MKSTNSILLILLMASFFVACGNDAVYDEESNREMTKKEKTEGDSIKKAEEAKEASYNYLESVDVSDVKYVWQKNLFWFIARSVTH